MSDHFQVICVKPKDGMDSPSTSTALEEAFDQLNEHDFSPLWATQEDCLQVEDSNKNCYYVMDPFEGAAFEHLKLLSCRIYGPQCILSTLLMKIEIPRRKHPIYNLAMKEVVVSCTNLDQEARNKVHNLVELMGGQAVRALTEEVTHLVAGEVGSQKYLVAAERGKHIVTVDWVLDIWEKAQHRYVSAVDEQFLKFRCPVFKGLVVTVSGLGTEDRKKVKRYVESEGGRYSGEMKLNECTHLILKEPRGPKYEFARKWRISIVSMKWLYESLDKNFCQDEKNYPVMGNSEGVKTSTPERSQKSAQVPNITDISAISASTAHVDETAFQATCMTSRMCDITMDNQDTIDLTVVSTEPFLDGCRVYLSGMQGPLLEKCKKIINAGGGTRFNAINECVTHVIMGDKCESDISTLTDVEERPHVVTPAWLAECFQKQRHVDEQPFLSPFVPADDIQLPNIKVQKRKPSAKGDKGKKGDIHPGQVSSNGGDTTAATVNKIDGDEMAEILSQYLVDGARDKVEGADQAVDEVDGSAATTEQNGNKDQDLTQEPQSQNTQSQGGTDGVFSGKTFIFCGFEDDDSTALAEMVKQAGGRVLKGQTRKVPDYAIVPIVGFPVEQTVGEVVTNAWLQICCESQALRDIDEHLMFRPFDIDETARPLENCVLSVSGYSGVERDCLIHIAELLGAVCQEYFVRKANKMLKASTHLIVKEASGSKYSAAIKWNIPALTRDWLFACAKSGKREDEQKYHIDNLDATGASTATETRTLTSLSNHSDAKAATGPKGAGSKTEGSKAENGTAGAASSARLDSDPMPSVAKGQHSSKTPSTQSGLPETTDAKSISRNGRVSAVPKHQEQTTAAAFIDRIPPSSAEMATSDSWEKVPSSSASEGEKIQPRQTELSNPMAGAKAMFEKTPCQRSQKENLTTRVKGKGLATPITDKRVPRGRIEELQQESHRPVLSPGLDSPSVFLAPDYRPKFDLKGVFAYLQSPEVPQKNSKKRESLPLEEVFQYHLAEGVKNSAVERDIDSPAVASQSQDEEKGPLEGVIIAVSKKLSGNQIEYNSIVTELGGDYTWQCSESCTHFIFQGRANDMNKEFRQAKSQGKIIVSPCWLYACQEQRSRVDESMYPHNYNPNMNLGGVVKTDIPGSGRPVRRSVRNTPKPSQVSGGKTPARSQRQKAWQESMSQMQGWQEGSKGSTPKGALEFVSESISSKRSSLEIAQDRSRSKRSSSETAEAEAKDQSKSKRSSTDSLREESNQDGSYLLSEKATGLNSNGDKDSDNSKMSKCDAGNVVEVADVQVEEAVKTTEESRQKEKGEGCSSPGICDALSKTLETLKAASSSRSKRSSKRRNRKADGSSSGGQLDISGNASDAGRQASPWQQHQQHPAHAPVQDSHHIEASQSLQITWDDPIGRREQEKLAHKLERVCSPSQNTEDFMAQMDIPDLDGTPVSIGKAQTDGIGRHEPKLDRSPTPEPPPLAFPTAKNVSRVSAPKPVELLGDESCDTDVGTAPPVILISGMKPRERVEYAALVEQLGGTVLEKQQFDVACTHLVVCQPTRNEKFLAAVATGRWVLHESYFIACRQEGRFVREEDHEWGNPSMSSLLSTLNAQTNRLAAAAHKWRKRVQDMKKADPQCKGAYQGWRVLLLTDKNKEDNFRRLLSAGGATVLNNRPPFTEALDATHAFVELHKVKLSETDMDILVASVVNVLKPEFIAAHLTDDPPPCPEEFTPAEVLALKNSLPDNLTRKRQATGSTSSGSSGKRSRR